MGMAAIGVALFKYVMRFSPRNPSYFNRDRFVLSNGTLPVKIAVLLFEFLTFFFRTYMPLSVYFHAPCRI